MGGLLKCLHSSTRGGGGVKNLRKTVYVVCVCPLVESASIYFDIKRLDGQVTTALYLASKKRNAICHWNESRQKKFEKQVRKTFGLLKGSSRIMLGFDI